MPLRWASLIATLSLLAWAATASAECAWVFWLEAGDARTHEKFVTASFGMGEREKRASRHCPKSWRRIRRTTQTWT